MRKKNDGPTSCHTVHVGRRTLIRDTTGEVFAVLHGTGGRRSSIKEDWSAESRSSDAGTIDDLQLNEVGRRLLS